MNEYTISKFMKENHPETMFTVRTNLKNDPVEILIPTLGDYGAILESIKKEFPDVEVTATTVNVFDN